MGTPRISIIVPNYNYSQYFDARMQSILSQTYQDYEIIILDDCSTDGSKDIIEKYRSNSKVRDIVYNTENSGSAFIQWDKGISLAKGELIWIAESDDLCSEKMLETLVCAFDSDKSCALSFCRSELLYSDIDKNCFHQNQSSLNKDFALRGIRFCKKYQWRTNTVINASSALFSKKAALNIKKEYLNYKGLGDLLFWIEIALQGNVHYFCEPLNQFRQHSGSQTSALQKTLAGHDESMRARAYMFRELKILNILQYYHFRICTLYRITRSDSFSTEEKDLFLSRTGFNRLDRIMLIFKSLTRRIALKSGRS